MRPRTRGQTPARLQVLAWLYAFTFMAAFLPRLVFPAERSVVVPTVPGKEDGFSRRRFHLHR